VYILGRCLAIKRADKFVVRFFAMQKDCLLVVTFSTEMLQHALDLTSQGFLIHKEKLKCQSHLAKFSYLWRINKIN
jgi:hypothetical protein